MNLKTTLSKYSVKPNSRFKKIFVVFSFAYLPVLVMFGILTGFSLMPVKFNDEDEYSIKGVTVLICFAPLMIVMFSGFTYLWYAFGNFVLQIFVTLSPDKK